MVNIVNFLKQRSIIAVLLVIIIFIISFVVYFMFFRNQKNQKTQVCFNETCFEVEVAKTKIAQTKGLMFRKSLDEREGMLFIFKNDGLYSFWMKNTLIALDIIFLDKDKKVVDIFKNVQPCRSEKCESYRNQKPAKYVLEINAGQAEEIGLEIGSMLLFELGL